MHTTFTSLTLLTLFQFVEILVFSASLGDTNQFKHDAITVKNGENTTIVSYLVSIFDTAISSAYYITAYSKYEAFTSF